MVTTYRRVLIWSLRFLVAATLVYVALNIFPNVGRIFDERGSAIREFERIAMVSGAGLGFGLILLAAAEVLAVQFKSARQETQ